MYVSVFEYFIKGDWLLLLEYPSERRGLNVEL